ncbi:MAG: hypothetical protein ACYTEQ_26330 [Planctomycetota bacterium]|jgi:hypothetical protein
MHRPFLRSPDWDVTSKRSYAPAELPNEKGQIQRQIAPTDKKIDQLVYKLYDLTREQIEIIEEANK